MRGVGRRGDVSLRFWIWGALEGGHLCYAACDHQWSTMPSTRPGMSRTWPKILNRFRGVPPGLRSRQVRGPAGAAILSSLEAGWGPQAPNQWAAPDNDARGGLAAGRLPPEELKGILIAGDPSQLPDDF